MPTSDKPCDKELFAQFQSLTLRAGLQIPDDGESRVFRGYRELREMTELMRRSQTGADEPALTFVATTITRGSDHG